MFAFSDLGCIGCIGWISFRLAAFPEAPTSAGAGRGVEDSARLWDLY